MTENNTNPFYDEQFQQDQIRRGEEHLKEIEAAKQKTIQVCSY